MLLLTGLMGLLVAGASIALLPDGSEGDVDVETDDAAEDTHETAAEGAGNLLDEIDGDTAAEGADATAPEETADDTAEMDLREQYEADLGADDEGDDDLDTDTDTVTTVPGIDTPEAPDSPEPSAGSDILWGDGADDRLEGLDGDDQMNGYDGDDILSGDAGEDRLAGGEGDDTLFGGTGDDRLAGEDGDDNLSGGAGDDSLTGAFGDDRLAGGEGDDAISGGQGDDSLLGDEGDDSLEGNDGDDTLSGGLGTDELFGGDGNDLIDGLVRGGESGETDLDGRDYLNGGEGADTLLTGTGDWASGNEGGDLFALGEWIDPEDPATIADFEPGADQIAVVYDPDSGEDPELTLEPSETDGAMWIVLNGVKLAEVLDAEGLTSDDIVLVTPSEFAYL